MIETSKQTPIDWYIEEVELFFNDQSKLEPKQMSEQANQMFKKALEESYKAGAKYGSDLAEGVDDFMTFEKYYNEKYK